jgi:hypothetical protein
VELRGVRHELVEPEEDEVGPVVHVDRAHPVHGRAGRDAHHRLLGQRGVEDALGPERRLQAARRAEHRGRIVNPLAEDEDAGVVLHGQLQRVVNRLDAPHHAPLGRIRPVVHQRVDQSLVPRHPVLFPQSA